MGRGVGELKGGVWEVKQENQKELNGKRGRRTRMSCMGRGVGELERGVWEVKNKNYVK